ncbi:MAG: hypothetical protein SH818_17165 [Saprospiraceae bacterium]|nr:hypothetical protein [Saprospiraceae bacterium]
MEWCIAAPPFISVLFTLSYLQHSGNFEEGLQHARLKDQEMRMRLLEKENEQLKILLAERDLESKLKDEFLKKNIPN